MPDITTRSNIWSATHTERAALAHDLATLTDDQWAHPSLCEQWSVEDVVAHLTASASIGPLRWITSVLSTRFDFDLHYNRRLAEHRGPTPAQTLAQFQRIITSTTAAPGPAAAWLGEILVHSEDIRHPLGLKHTAPIEATTTVATFYARRNFAIPTRSTITGLHIEATDGPFTTGEGPLVRGSTLALIMVIAGRGTYCDELTGPGVPTLRARSSPPEPER